MNDYCNDENLNRILPPEERNSGGKTRKRDDIQCLRGVAIIYVLLFHLFPSVFPKGFLGVDIFFVISGYLITMILSRNTPISLADTGTFFSKRIRRIFPAYYLMIFAVLVFGRIFLTSYDQHLLAVDSGWTLAFLSNVHKYFQQKDYFAQIGNYDFLLHAWSLAVEMQFYCTAPLLASIAHRLRFGKMVIATTAILSLVVHVKATGELQFSSLPSRLWQFLAGSFAFELRQKVDAIPDMVSKVVAVVAAILISPVILFIPNNEFLCRLTVTAAATLIVARISPSVNDFFNNETLLLTGDISYSLYLVHWPVIIFFRYIHHADKLLFTESLIVAQLSFLLAYLSFKTIEKYFIRENLAKALIFTSLLFFSSIMLMNYPKVPLLVLKQQINQSSTTMLLPDESENGTVAKTSFENDCFAFRYQDYRPEEITSSMLRDAQIANERFMHYWPKDIPEDSLPDPLVDKYFRSKNINIPLTAYYKNSGKTSIAIFGNSFAHRSLYAVIRAFGQRAKEIRLLANVGCPPFIGSIYTDSVGVECGPFLNASVELIEEMKPDITFLIFRPFDPIDSPIINLTKDNQFNNIQYTIDRISAVTKRIVIEYPLPVNKKRFYTPFLMQHLRDAKPSLDDVKIDYSFFWSKTKHIFKRLDSVKCSKCDRIYTHKLFCDFKICRVFDPENLYSFFDMGSHYNDYAMKCFEKVYSEIINENYANGVIE
uniref:O-acetyltransferase oatA n=1 Tax=Ascaris suum TaxID=6253 RepID=F1KYS5_ASCSU